MDRETSTARQQDTHDESDLERNDSFGLVNIPVGLFTAVSERPFQFHFLHQEALLGVIKQKLAGKPISARAKSQETTNVVDIMSKLKASLKQVKPAQRRKKTKAA